MTTDDAHSLMSLLELLRSGVWLVLLAHVLAAEQAKEVARRSADKADRRTVEAATEALVGLLEGPCRLHA